MPWSVAANQTTRFPVPADSASECRRHIVMHVASFMLRCTGLIAGTECVYNVISDRARNISL